VSNLTKHSGPLAEAATIVDVNGLAENVYGDASSGEGYNFLTIISADILKDLQAPDELVAKLIDQYPALTYDQEVLVWAKENDVGFVDVIEFAEGNGKDWNAIIRMFNRKADRYHN